MTPTRARYPFWFEWKVPFYDSDPLLRLRPSAVLRYMQEAATRHLESLGLAHARLLSEGILFVLAAQAIKFYRSPAPQESILVATAPVAGRGAHMIRETVILSESGDLLVEGQSSWAMIDPASQRLLRACEFPHALPMLEGEWHPFRDPTRLRPRVTDTPLGERTVRSADIDRNHHMNNTVYADVMLDCFPEQYLSGGGIDELLLRYRRQARLGETIALSGDAAAESCAVCGRIEDKICFEGMFSLKALDSAEAGC